MMVDCAKPGIDKSIAITPLALCKEYSIVRISDTIANYLFFFAQRLRG